MSLICGIVGIGLSFVPSEISWLAIVLTLLAIIFGCVSLGRISRGLASGRGMAVTGLITGVIGLVLFLFALVYVFSHPNEF